MNREFCEFSCAKIAVFSFSCTLASPTLYFALFKAQEDGVFTATCHTSKTRLSEKFEMRFSHLFSASANAHRKALARRLIKLNLNVVPLDFARDLRPSNSTGAGYLKFKFNQKGINQNARSFRKN
jgi:hypothetical protein